VLGTLGILGSSLGEIQDESVVLEVQHGANATAQSSSLLLPSRRVVVVLAWGGDSVG
jgi:hypothetical protein